MGLVYYTAVFYWLLVALVYYTPLAILAFLMPVLILSGFLAAATLAIHRTHTRLRWPLWFSLGVFWTANEWFPARAFSSRCSAASRPVTSRVPPPAKKSRCRVRISLAVPPSLAVSVLEVNILRTMNYDSRSGTYSHQGFLK